MKDGVMVFSQDFKRLKKKMSGLAPVPDPLFLFALF